MKPILYILLLCSLKSFGQGNGNGNGNGNISVGGNNRQIECYLDSEILEGQNLTYNTVYSKSTAFLIMQENSQLNINKELKNLHVVFSNNLFDEANGTRPKIVFKKCFMPNATFSNWIDIEFPRNCNIQVTRNNY